VAFLIQVHPILTASVISDQSGQHATVFPINKACLPLYAILRHPLMMPTIAPIWLWQLHQTVSPNHPLSSLMSHLCLHPSSLHSQACSAVSPCNGGSIRHLLAHRHNSFCTPLSEPTPTECSNASSSVAVAPLATLASLMLAVLLAWAGMHIAWCYKTSQRMASIYARHCWKGLQLGTIRCHNTMQWSVGAQASAHPRCC
jgi:hypothetical protein